MYFRMTLYSILSILQVRVKRGTCSISYNMVFPSLLSICSGQHSTTYMSQLQYVWVVVSRTLLPNGPKKSMTRRTKIFITDNIDVNDVQVKLNSDIIGGLDGILVTSPFGECLDQSTKICDIPH